MAVKKKTAKRATKNSAANKAKGRRYSAAEKAKVLAFAEKVNSENGRGGITAASEEFGVTPLTISAWMRKAGVATRGVALSQATPEVFQRLAELHNLIVKAEEELANLNKEYAALKRKL